MFEKRVKQTGRQQAMTGRGRKILTLAAVAALIGVSACDEVNSDLERAIVGGAIGCAAGEVLVEGRCAEGAIVGAGVGVLTN